MEAHATRSTLKTLMLVRARLIACRWDLVAINPPLIFGPPVTSRPDGESVDIIRKAANNEFWLACPRMGECGRS